MKKFSCYVLACLLLYPFFQSYGIGTPPPTADEDDLGNRSFTPIPSSPLCDVEEEDEPRCFAPIPSSTFFAAEEEDGPIGMSTPVFQEESSLLLESGLGSQDLAEEFGSLQLHEPQLESGLGSQDLAEEFGSLQLHEPQYEDSHFFSELSALQGQAVDRSDEPTQNGETPCRSSAKPKIQIRKIGGKSVIKKQASQKRTRFKLTSPQAASSLGELRRLSRRSLSPVLEHS